MCSHRLHAILTPVLCLFPDRENSFRTKISTIFAEKANLVEILFHPILLISCLNVVSDLKSFLLIDKNMQFTVIVYSKNERFGLSRKTGM